MTATSWLREHSHIWGVVSVAAENVMFWYKTNCDSLQKLLAATTARKETVSTMPANNQIVQSLNANGSRDAVAKSTQYLWPIANCLIERMQQICAANKSQFILVRLPASKNYENKTETALLANTAASLHIPLLDLGPSFHRQSNISNKPLFFDFHLTAAGHAYLAGQLFHFVVEKQVINLNQQSSGDNKSTGSPWQCRQFDKARCSINTACLHKKSGQANGCI